MFLIILGTAGDLLGRKTIGESCPNLHEFPLTRTNAKTSEDLEFGVLALNFGENYVELLLGQKIIHYPSRAVVQLLNLALR